MTPMKNFMDGQGHLLGKTDRPTDLANTAAINIGTCQITSKFTHGGKYNAHVQQQSPPNLAKHHESGRGINRQDYC